MYLELRDISSLMFQLIQTKNLIRISLFCPPQPDPNLNLVPRPFIDEAKGKISSNPNLYMSLSVRNATGNERADAQNKSSIFDVLNNESDTAMKFFLTKCGYGWFSQWCHQIVKSK